jgi:competence protein ComEA
MPQHPIRFVVLGCALLASASSASRPQVMSAPGYYLPRPAPPSASPAPPRAPASGLLDLNTATPAQLAALPGMGREYARRVIAGRPYHAKNQLVRRGILPSAAYARIRDLVVAHRATALAARPR